MMLAFTLAKNVHRGSVLPIARVVVILVPVAAMCFYVFVMKARRK